MDRAAGADFGDDPLPVRADDHGVVVRSGAVEQSDRIARTETENAQHVPGCRLAEREQAAGDERNGRMDARNLHAGIIADPVPATAVIRSARPGGLPYAGRAVNEVLPLRVLIPTGILQGARQVASPNWDSRPRGVDPELIVVHGISLPPGEFGGPYIDRLFTNTLDPAAHPCFADIAGLRVSSHLLIRRDGEIVQYVPLHGRAWHAGPSRFAGREACNDFSIGIELEGADDVAYEAVQYERLCATIGALRAAMPSLVGAPVVGHSDVAPGRKTDPGPAFDWRRLDALLAAAGANRPGKPPGPGRPP